MSEDISNFTNNTEVKDPNRGLPKWNNEYLSTFESLLIGSSGPALQQQPDYREKLSEGENIPEFHKVRAILDHVATSEVVTQVREHKKYIPVTVFGTQGFILLGDGLHPAVELPLPDENGEVRPEWKVVLLNGSGKVVTDSDKLKDLSLASVSSTFLKATYSDEEGLIIRYNSKKS